MFFHVFFYPSSAEPNAVSINRYENHKVTIWSSQKTITTKTQNGSISSGDTWETTVKCWVMQNVLSVINSTPESTIVTQSLSSHLVIYGKLFLYLSWNFYTIILMIDGTALKNPPALLHCMQSLSRPLSPLSVGYHTAIPLPSRTPLTLSYLETNKSINNCTYLVFISPFVYFLDVGFSPKSSPVLTPH